MNHHYKNLLLNLPVRHIINKIETINREALKEQLRRMYLQEIRNFFFLGTSENIHMALSAANELMYYGNQFAWFAGTKVKYKR